VQHRSQAQGGARASSSGCHVATSGAAVAGPGLRSGRVANVLVVVGHRILRRVLTDGRHPGSKEASLFTGRRGERSRRLSHPRDPHAHPKGRGRTSRKRMHTRRRVRPRARGGSDRDVRGSVLSGTVGRKTPTLVIKVGDDLGARRSQKWKACSVAIRRSGPNVVKRSFPRSCCAET
jgi:hypothetical protein